MWRSISRRRRLAYLGIGAVWVLFPLAFIASQRISAPFPIQPWDFLFNSVGGGATNFLPFIAGVLILPDLGALLTQNALPAVRVRRALGPQLARLFGLGAARAGVVGALTIVVSGVVSGILGEAIPGNTAWGPPSENFLSYLSLENWPAFIAIVSAWTALHVVLYTAVAFALRLLFSQRWIAYTMPMVGMFALTIVLTVLGFSATPQRLIAGFLALPLTPGQYLGGLAYELVIVAALFAAVRYFYPRILGES